MGFVQFTKKAIESRVTILKPYRIRQMHCVHMPLLGIFLDIIYLNVESGFHLKQFGKIFSRKKRLLIKGMVDTDSAVIDAVIVLPEIKSQTFNNPTLSNKKKMSEEDGDTYGKMFS